ncbi:MAG: cell division protein FtsZ, partial [Alphaproteobacteria bacterium]|nr:cell division protein FtsZ [Alphaproteobacteria bacterium]
AFALEDDVLYQGVKGVTDLMVRPGLINLDFADVRAVMDEMGKAMMGTGEAEGEDRAKQAAQKAIANPLLDEISLKGAKGVLINITGGYDLTLFELDEAANEIREMVDPDANIIVGSTLDTSMEGKMRVSVVATGIDALAKTGDVPVPRRSMSMTQPIRNPEPAPRREEPAAARAPQPEYREAPRQQPAAREERQPAPRQDERQQPAARQPAPRQEERQPAPRHEERSLFESMEDDRRQQPQDDYADMQDTGYEDDDALPPPAYRPRPEPEIEASESFVAPRAPAPGTPTPEAMARLQAAVGRQPRTGGVPRVTEQAPRAAEGEKPRFGINSLINRMTGQGEAPAQPAPRQQPQVSALRDQPRADPQADADQERIEIPAFLRRQAN